jgi:Fe2+ transport system protein B
VIVVASAPRLDEELADLLPLVQGRRGLVVTTFWDKIADTAGARDTLDRLGAELGVRVVAVDARRLASEEARRIETELSESGRFQTPAPTTRAGWSVEPALGPLDRPVLGRALAIALALLPSFAVVLTANRFAALLDPAVTALLETAVSAVKGWPQPFAAVLSGRFGLLTMGPLLLVWALPTVLLHALLLGLYKASGLAERINGALEPLVRPFGLGGRDVLRIMMGFGCNVPAVIATRSSSACHRPVAVSAIAFGAACSYQFPATLAVFTASGRPWLAWAWLGWLLLTTMAYLHLTAPRRARSPLDVLTTPPRPFLSWPAPRDFLREAAAVIRQFLAEAMPIFLLVAVVAALLDHMGLIAAVTGALAPLAAIFNLPPSTMLPTVVSAIRKDGILLFLAPAEGGGGLIADLTPVQTLTAVFLAGTLVPCLVTAMTAAREISVRATLGILGRQFVFAAGFALVLAWSGWALGW